MAFFIDDRKLIESIEDDKIAYLTTANDSFEASLICELLRDSGIPCMSKDRFAGATAKVFTGLSSMGTDVFVARPRLKDAREIVNAYMNEAKTDESNEE